MNIEIANRLVQLRKANNLSQEELAAKIGISRQAVSKWERAEASPDTDNLIALARLYRISLDELLRAEEPSVPEAAEKPMDTAAAPQSSALVNIGTGHLHVEDGGHAVHIEDGHANGVQMSGDTWRENRWLRFPYPLLALIVFLGLGFGGGWWHPGWLVFLAVPVVDSAVEVVTERKSWWHFAYPVLAVLVFLMLGFFGGWWVWCWMVFLTIPLYYALFPKETV